MQSLLILVVSIIANVSRGSAEPLQIDRKSLLDTFFNCQEVMKEPTDVSLGVRHLANTGSFRSNMFYFNIGELNAFSCASPSVMYVKSQEDGSAEINSIVYRMGSYTTTRYRVEKADLASQIGITLPTMPNQCEAMMVTESGVSLRMENWNLEFAKGDSALRDKWKFSDTRRYTLELGTNERTIASAATVGMPTGKPLPTPELKPLEALTTEQLSIDLADQMYHQFANYEGRIHHRNVETLKSGWDKCKNALTKLGAAIPTTNDRGRRTFDRADKAFKRIGEAFVNPTPGVGLIRSLYDEAEKAAEATK